MGAPKTTKLVGGPLIPGRSGRKGCAKARQKVKHHSRLCRPTKKPAHSRQGGMGLPGSEKPQPKPGVYFSQAPAHGSQQAKGYKAARPVPDLATWHSRARLREKRGGSKLVKVVPR